jgi:hypothetical protein
MLWPVVQTPAFAGPQNDASTDRTAQVRQASKDVMPFSMEATQHRFRKTETGGVQTVVARDSDVGQTKMVREHLHRIAEQFSARDFSGPAHVHGQSMPGLSEMRASKPGELEVAYAEVPDGGTVTYVAHTQPLVDAVHRWFDAQVSDHGPDARAQ